MHPDDNLVLEDESGRVNLKGSVLSPSVYVTGLYCDILQNEFKFDMLLDLCSTKLVWC